jgi:DNA-binding transcriptional regulator YiaG
LKKAPCKNSLISKKSAYSADGQRNSSIDARKDQLFDNIECDELLTAVQLAERLNIAVRTVRKWRYERVLPTECMVKLRYQVRYRWGKVVAWIATKGV